MKRINSYQDFILENKVQLLLEAQLKFSEEFEDVIREMDHIVAEMIKGMFFNGHDVETKLNFIDTTDKNDRLSFTADAKGQKFLDEDDEKSPYLKNRNEVKVGKLIRKLVQGINQSSDKNISGSVKQWAGEVNDKHIEEFVNQYKSTFDMIKGKMDRFELVSGDQIKRAYFELNYDQLKGTLGSSCMRHGKCQDYFSMYTENIDEVKLLVLYSDKEGEFVDEDTGEIVKSNLKKVIGRALVWEGVAIDPFVRGKAPDPDNMRYDETFMDRVYTSNDSDERLFILHAQQNGWYYKEDQDSDEDTELFSPEDNYEESDSYNVVSEITAERYDNYPYLDTLKYYQYRTGYLSNTELNGSPSIKLEDISGDFECDTCDGEGTEECSSCDGSGAEPCYSCGGQGKRECHECDGYATVGCRDCDSEGMVDCEECNGSGEDEDGDDCSHCGGDMRVQCEECDGDGSIDCQECNGEGDLDCGDCDGSGAEECSSCSGEGNDPCSECGYGDRT